MNNVIELVRIVETISIPDELLEYLAQEYLEEERKLTFEHYAKMQMLKTNVKIIVKKR